MTRLGVIAGLLLALVSASSGSAAGDALPGQNGRIAFTSIRATGGGELYTLNPNGGPLQRLTTHAPIVGRAPSWSPDGRSVVIVNASQQSDAAIVDLRSKRVRPLRLPIRDITDIAWSPEGRRFAYSGDLNYNAGLWLARTDGRVQRNLTSGSHYDAAWSPRGDRIAYTNSYYADLPQIEIVGADGRGSRDLGLGDDPSWSPDGKQLVVRVANTFAVVSADGHGRRTLLRLPVDCGASGAAWSPMGEIVYVVGCDRSELRAIRPDGTHRRTLIKNLPAFMPSLSWSPGGTMLAFADTNGTAWLANGDGSGLRRLFSAPAGSDSNPVWSPDGRRLAANLAGTPEHHTNTRLVSATVHNPSWSPDGRRLIGLQGDGDNRVVVVDLASGNERVIYEDKGIGYVTLVDPAWSPANVIAFAEVDSGTIDLYDMRRRMFVGPRRRIEGTEPAWSPDGRRLAYHTAGGIYVADADGTGRRLVARNAAQPAWSPDGRQIAFVRTLAGGNTEIFVTDADGSRQRRLTFNPGPDLAPDWQPRPR